jgi:hypothetical protein
VLSFCILASHFGIAPPGAITASVTFIYVSRFQIATAGAMTVFGKPISEKDIRKAAPSWRG